MSPGPERNSDFHGKPVCGRKVVNSRATILFPVIIAIVSFVVYFNALSSDFVYDDKEQVLENIWIRDIRHLPEIFSKSVWGFATEVEDQGTANYYRPFMHLVYMAEYYAFGLRPWGFHLVNILFHAGASIMVFLIAAKLFFVYRTPHLPDVPTAAGGEPILEHSFAKETEAGFSRSALYDPRLYAFIAGLLFATHPIHTEAVTWIASLPEVAFSFFYLLSFYFYIRYREEERPGGKLRHAPTALPNYALSLLSYSISVFFKEPALTLPLVLFAYDYAFRPRAGSMAKVLKGYTPYLAVGAAYLILRLIALKSMVPTVTFGGLSSYQAIINVFPLFLEYLKDLLFPFTLNFWHPFDPLQGVLNSKGLLSLGVSALFGAVIILSWKKNRIVFLGLILILAPLLPAFYIKGIGSKPYAERYLYLPSVGFVLMVALFLLWIWQKVPRHGHAITAAALMLAAAFSAQTVIRNSVWKDSFTFYADAIEKAPDAVPLRISYGVLLSDAGKIDEAVSEYKTAIRLGPDYWQAHANLGVAYGKRGMIDKAIEEMEIALRLNPNSVATRSNLGNAYLRKRLIDQAVGMLETAVRLNPAFFAAHFNLAAAYEQKGLLDEAIEEYAAALRIKPGEEDTNYLLGRAYANAGRLDDAISQFVELTKLRPLNASHHNTLGALYAQKGLLDRALRQFETAVKLDPEKPSYRQNLERAKAQQVIR